jgi:NTP pyrophosphatase (non-canonical NTP hydrolase)
MMVDRKLISDNLGREEILCQLAEECAELSQAALKLRRAYSGKNPTPVTIQKAIDNLLEEIADVRLCVETLFLTPAEEETVSRTINQKVKRWSERIQKATEKGVKIEQT